MEKAKEITPIDLAKFLGMEDEYLEMINESIKKSDDFIEIEDKVVDFGEFDIEGTSE